MQTNDLLEEFDRDHAVQEDATDVAGDGCRLPRGRVSREHGVRGEASGSFAAPPCADEETLRRLRR